MVLGEGKGEGESNETEVKHITDEIDSIIGDPIVLSDDEDDGIIVASGLTTPEGKLEEGGGISYPDEGSEEESGEGSSLPETVSVSLKALTGLCDALEHLTSWIAECQKQLEECGKIDGDAMMPGEPSTQ